MTKVASTTKRAAKLRRRALDALASAHGLADVVAALRAREKTEHGRKIAEGMRRAKAERERVRREVGVIFLALLLQRYGTA